MTGPKLNRITSSPEPAGAEPAADGHIAEEGETSADEVAVEGIVLAGRQL